MKIAIVGRGCVLPGACDPQSLGDLSTDARSVIREAPADRWGIGAARIYARSPRPDTTGNNRGGYVQAPRDGALDPVFTWLVQAGGDALRDAGMAGGGERIGAVIGNLSFPTTGMARFCEEAWLRQIDPRSSAGPVDARNRFMSGLPAHFMARELGLGGEAFCLDAACASSLYAIAIACDRLRDGSADAMVAGAVNAADDLFLHVGFGALKALSPTGRSRPFHRHADGLLPAEGAALVVLERLEDAVANGRTIHGVIRGIGLSNDGRAAGFLVPSQAGQVRAMRAAYEQAEIDPADVSWVECHATGTHVGDGIEIASMLEVFGARSTPLSIGSLKANVGHLITAAGAAGLLRVLEAMRRNTLPPTPHTDELHEALTGTPLMVLQSATPWHGPQVAGVSAFGFGGNNAHLIVQAWRPDADVSAAPSVARDDRVAIVALGAHVGRLASVAAVADALFADASEVRPGAPGVSRDAAYTPSVEVSLTGARFPPRDLEETLPQQLLLMNVCSDALAAWGGTLDAERTGVLVGMQCDTVVARHGARWRMAEWGARWGASDSWIATARDAWAPLLGSAGVLGCMPNICANRINSLFDLRGPSFTVSSEELSGVRALELGRHALLAGMLDLAIVAAADMCAEPAHVEALDAMEDTRAPGDAAVAVVLERLEDARRRGHKVLAVLDDTAPDAEPWDEAQVERRFGHAHAASGLLQVMLATVASARGGDSYQLALSALGGQQARVVLRSVGTESIAPPISVAGPTLTVQAHLAPPHFPSLPSRAVEVMEPTPALAPVTAPPPRQRRESAPAAVHVGSPAVHADYQTLLDLRQRQLEVHQAYLRAQDAAHARFVARQQQLWRTWSFREPPPPQAKAVLFDKDALRVHASGRISEIFGAAFEQQDAHAVQVRMPSGKLLLADRVTRIEATPGELGQGTVWTETDVLPDSWFLHVGRMPAGLMIEAGQADLFLISYMGIDFFNRGERAYRLLGCDVTYRRSLPRVGETLRYDIHIDGHAQQGDVRLFFFHYDCRIGDDIVLSVRDGQAGFFSAEELATSDGVLWRPEDQRIERDARLDAPLVSTGSQFDAAQVARWAAGDLYGCFGAGFERSQTHVRTPTILGGEMCFIDTVDAFDARGGPWGRGYLRAKTAIYPERWYFDGHFENDPCMPGTLMLEGCLQMMAFYLAGLGYTLDRDGWRFEPLPEHTSKLRCRGQVLPTSRELVCEIFVEEVHDGPEPIVYADLLGTIDGVKAFHARRMALRLVPDWPLSTAVVKSPTRERPLITMDGFTFDYTSLMACAIGRPSRAFGPMYAPFDGIRRVARLPGAPYHFMSHVGHIDGPIGGMQTGTTIVVDYDLEASEWYFGANPSAHMPFCVLLEAVLQPCGWLASYIGSALTTETDLCFRNLDGTGVVHVDVLPRHGMLRTKTTVTQISQTAGMIIESFRLTCHAGDTLVYELDTVFGFFPQEALQNQVGLPTGDVERASLSAPGENIDLRARPARFFEGAPRLPEAPLLMLDRVRGLRLDGGAAGLGSAIGEKDVDPSEWFFKAHFFQDPVQPGSLGIEAMLQLLQLFMLRADMHAGMASPRFEAVRLGSSMTWKYRGQVIPDNHVITTTLEITARGRDERGVYATARASLWVDGKRIYEALDLGMRIVSGA